MCCIETKYVQFPLSLSVCLAISHKSTQKNGTDCERTAVEGKWSKKVRVRVVNAIASFGLNATSAGAGMPNITFFKIYSWTG
jgi:hypothetical protein